MGLTLALTFAASNRFYDQYRKQLRDNGIDSLASGAFNWPFIENPRDLIAISSNMIQFGRNINEKKILIAIGSQSLF